MAGRKPSKNGRDTKERILDAALETVRKEGLVGTSARAIAATGSFNQALVFYHFGSVEDLLLAALARANERRIARFTEPLAELDDLAGLVAVARDLHGGDADADQAALSAIVAGWSGSSELGPRVLEVLEPWNRLVADALRRIFERHPLGGLVPVEDLARLIAALFLGVEMFSRLEDDGTRTDAAFASMAGLAAVLDPLLVPTHAGPVA